MLLFFGIVIGFGVMIGLRKAWNAFQLYEIERRFGNLRSKEINCQPGKWGKRFKYLHNFIVETRLHLRAQLFNLKQALLKLCLEHNVLNFKASPLGKCLQASVDLETKIFGAAQCLVFFHESFLVEFKDYLYSITHPDPVIYGREGVGEGEKTAGGVDLNHCTD